jgi:hypothetical protein
MKLDFYGLNGQRGLLEPDIEHDLPREEAARRIQAGQLVLVKLWLRTNGAVDLQDLEARLAAVLAPLGLK